MGGRNIRETEYLMCFYTVQGINEQYWSEWVNGGGCQLVQLSGTRVGRREMVV